MLKIVSLVVLVLVVISGVVFVRYWNSTTPWGAGTGSINPAKVKAN